MKNKYARRSKISEDKFRKIVRYFALEFDAHKIAALTRLNRNTIDRYLNRIRERLYAVCARQSPFVHRSRPLVMKSSGKTPIFGLKAHGVRVHTEVVPVSSTHRLRRLLKAADGKRALCLPARWAGYEGIVDMESRQLYGPAAFTAGKGSGMNSSRMIEVFLEFAGQRMFQRRLADWDRFGLQLKECEFRFNHREEDLYQLMLKIFRERPLN